MLFREKDSSLSNPDNSGMSARGRARRNFLLRSGGAVGVAGAAYLNRGKIIDALTPGLPSLPDIDNPFKRKTKEEILGAIITGIIDCAEVTPLKITERVKVRVEKDAKILDFLFDSAAEAEIDTLARITTDFSPFLPPPAAELDHPAMAPDVPDKRISPQVGMVGGIPALVLSDDLRTVTVTLPHPELPKAGEIIPDFATARIKYGKGGLEDKIENWTGTSSIRDTELYRLAQKAALQKLKEDPTLIPRAKAKVDRLLRSLLILFETVNINFVNPYAGPEMPTATQAPKPAAQAKGK